MSALDWIPLVAGSPELALACAAGALLAAFGLGRLTLSWLNLEFRRNDFRDLAALALGLDAFAFAAAALSLLNAPQFPTQMTLAAAVPLALYGLCLLGTGVAGLWRHYARAKFLPALMLLALPFALYLGAALCPPVGWDELVYQLAVPQRWNASGLAEVYGDLPYSGFPSLPQFLYWLIMGAGGAISAKLLAFSAFVAMAASVFLLCRLRASVFASAAMTLAFLVAPVLSFIGKEAYAEQFIAFNLLAALLAMKGLKRRSSKRAALLCGILGGACAAVKLTGLFACAAIILIGMMKRRRRLRELALFIFAAALFAAPFYARPALQTGNPFHPYYAEIFEKGEAALESSQYHQAAGSARFGADGLPGLLSSPLLLSIPFSPFQEICDGSFGLQLPAFLLLALLAFALRKRAKEHFKLSDFAFPCALLLLYLLWFASAKQARFLLPAFAIACALGASALPKLSKKTQLLAILAILALASISFDARAVKHCLICWRSLGNPSGPASLVYNGTGDDYLPAIDAMLAKTPKNSKILLLFEERTLYIPRSCQIGTPFFQAALLTPPDRIDAASLEKALADGEFTHVYLRSPENNPDLVRSYAERCAPLANAAAELEGKGALKALWRSQSAALYAMARQK